MTLSNAKVPFVDLGWQFKQDERTLLDGMRRIGRSGNFVLGQENELLEAELRILCNVKHVVTVGNGSDAIFLTLKALGIGPGDEVITAPNSFIATAWTIIAAGATPVFADVDDTSNISPDALREKIGPATKAIIAVHLAGFPSDISSIRAIIGASPIALIEDCAQAFGTKSEGQHVGSLGEAGAFSLHPLKNLGVLGDGGFVTTNNDALASKLRLLRNHGLSNRDNMDIWGYNSRLDEIQAFVARIRLRRFPMWSKRIRKIEGLYRRALQGLGESLTLPPRSSEADVLLHNFVIRTDLREQLRLHLAERGIETRIHYPIPIHLQEGARELGHKRGDFPVAEIQAETSLSLPLHPGMTSRHAKLVASSIIEFYQSQHAS